MADNSLIEWTDATWNPITGCSIVSPGCKHCYAMKLAGGRLQHHPTRAGLTQATKAGPVWTGEVRFNEKQLLEPLRWSRPRKIFVCAHGDLFAEGVPDEWIDQVFAVMALCPQHVFQVLTKRPGRARAYLTSGRSHPVALEALSLVLEEIGRNPRSKVGSGIIIQGDVPHLQAWPLPNVWLGISAEDQQRADERIPDLLATPARVRFLSLEPLLGPINIDWAISPFALDIAAGFLHRGCFSPGLETLRPLDWVIVGGESGDGARPMHPDWARSSRDQCAAAGVPFFFKQWGVWTPGENVKRNVDVVETAHLFNDRWTMGSADLSRSDGHRDDEPDLYLVGKKAAGRLLDGVEHNGMPT